MEGLGGLCWYTAELKKNLSHLAACEWRKIKNFLSPRNLCVKQLYKLNFLVQECHCMRHRYTSSPCKAWIKEWKICDLLQVPRSRTHSPCILSYKELQRHLGAFISSAFFRRSHKQFDKWAAGDTLLNTFFSLTLEILFY